MNAVAATASVLTVTLASGTFAAVYTADDLGAAQRDARTLLDAGHTVSLRRAAEGTEQAVDGDVVIALAKHARDTRFAGDRPVAYRVIRTEVGATVVWLMLAGETRGRGYIIHSSRAFDSMQSVSGAPTQGLYMYGFARLRTVQPVESAAIVRDWTAL